ncbi:hypothetical protein P2318_34635 [Myxococcaceae bacterium GXIMD 01537]
MVNALAVRTWPAPYRELARWFLWPFAALFIVGLVELLVDQSEPLRRWFVPEVDTPMTLSGAAGDCFVVTSPVQITAQGIVLVLCAHGASTTGFQVRWLAIPLFEAMRLSYITFTVARLLVAPGESAFVSWNEWSGALWLSGLGILAIGVACWVLTRRPWPGMRYLVAMALGLLACAALWVSQFRGGIFPGAVWWWS